MEEVQVDTPKAMEIRIRVVCTSLCRSDVTQWESKVSLPPVQLLVFLF